MDSEVNDMDSISFLSFSFDLLYHFYIRPCFIFPSQEMKIVKNPET